MFVLWFQVIYSILEFEVFLALSKCKQEGPENTEYVTKNFPFCPLGLSQLLVRQDFGSNLLGELSRVAMGTSHLSTFHGFLRLHHFESEQTNDLSNSGSHEYCRSWQCTK